MIKLYTTYLNKPTNLPKNWSGFWGLGVGGHLLQTGCPIKAVEDRSEMNYELVKFCGLFQP